MRIKNLKTIDKRELVNICVEILENLRPCGCSTTDNKNQYLGVFEVYGHSLGDLSCLIWEAENE